MFLATLLIAISLGILALVGLVYLLFPQHLSYHRTVMETLGEEVLARKLNLLSMILSAAVVMMMFGHSLLYRASGTLFFHSSERVAFYLGICLGCLVSPWMISTTHALMARRGAGMMILTFCAMETFLLSAGYRAGVILAGGLAIAILAYVTLGTRALGKQTGAKTPWPVLAALCALFALGTALALFA